MSGLITPTSGGKQYKMMFVTLSGREYMVTLTAMGAFLDVPPFIAWEQADGTITATIFGIDRRYSSIDHLSSEHGCVISDSVSVDPTN